MLPHEALDEYKLLMKDEYGRDVSDSEAQDEAHRLLGFFELLLKIDNRGS